MTVTTWLSALFPPVERCPGCAGRLASTTAEDLVVFVCTACGQGWHFELGYAQRVGTVTGRG